MAAGETYRLCEAAGRSARQPSSMVRKAGSPSRDSASASRIVNLSEGFFEPNPLSAVIERQESYEMNEAKIARIVGISFGTLWIVIFGLRLLSGT
jgi:hypothetical protein